MLTFLCILVWFIYGVVSAITSPHEPRFIKKRDKKAEEKGYDVFFDEAWDDDEEYVEYESNEEGGKWFKTLCLALAATLTVVVVVLFGEIATKEYVISQKYVFYEAENKAIESKISELVNVHIRFLDSNYAGLEDINPIAAASVMPTLYSDNYVKTQIKIYSENLAKMQKLKEEDIELASGRWNLYFGR